MSLWNSNNSLEITAINYGIGNAGSTLPLTDDFATTDVDVANDKITLGIDLATGTGIKFTTTAADLPNPLVVGTLYFAIRVDATHIKVATTYANADAGTEITLTDQGTGTHTVTMDNEYHIWNDKGNILTSSPMTSVLVTVRDSNGQLIENITTQGWVEMKSLTIHAGADGGVVGDYVDDNMADWKPIGKDNHAIMGDIPYDCYRKVQFRIRIPTSALTAGVSFKIYVTCQQPQVAVANWFTGIHGDGVIYLAAGAFGVSINGGDASLLDVEKGFSLISTSSIYYGNAQQYDVSGLSNGTYKIYLTQSGVISSILEASAIPANSIELTRAVVAGGICTGVTDKRNFIASVMTGLDAAKTATPTTNQLYIATDTTKVYACFVDDSWTIIYDPNTVTKTGTFTAGRMVKINNASGIIEMASNTDTEVADAVTKKHSQNTDTGTTQTTFQIDSGNSGPKVKNNSGVLEARNSADNAYVAFKALLLTLVEGIDLLGTGKEILAKVNTLSFTEQVLTSGAAIAWDLKNGNKAILVAAHNHTVTITKPSGAIDAVLIITQDATGSRVLDEIITQKDDSIATTDVHADTEIIDIGIDIPTGARIRFKTSAADLPDPLVVDTIYYAIRVSATEIKVATNKANAFAGTAINITDQGTGTHEVQQLVKWPGGTLGVLQTAAGAEDVIKLHYKTSDEQWYAELVANFS